MNAEIWTKQIEKMQNKINSWGMMWINMGGRVILIKTLVVALLIYQYALIMAPASAHKQMELILRSFFYGRGGARKQNV